MKSILSQLFDGEIYPIRDCLPYSEEYLNKQSTSNQHQEDFIKKLKKLDPSLCEEYLKTDEEILAVNYLAGKEAFIYGFCLGTKIISEVLTKDI